MDLSTPTIPDLVEDLLDRASMHDYMASLAGLEASYLRELKQGGVSSDLAERMLYDLHVSITSLCMTRISNARPGTGYGAKYVMVASGYEDDEYEDEDD